MARDACNALYFLVYTMMYSQSQRANWFQVSLAGTLKQFGISQQRIASLRNLGIVVHPQTIKASIAASSASHLERVKEFFQTIIENEEFIIFCVDDYHNIYTIHRPESKTQTQSVHTTTLLFKFFRKSTLCQMKRCHPCYQHNLSKKVF